MEQLTEQQAEEIKKQLIKQLKNWPAEKAEPAIKQILSMDKDQLLNFLKQNKIIRDATPQELSQIQTQKKSQECIFCLLAENKIPSFKIGENKSSIAVLEINPLTPGHTIIIPKKHYSKNKIPTSAFTLAKKLTTKLKSKLKPKDIEMTISELANHGIINLIPIYDKKPTERKKAEESELKQLQEKLLTKSKPRKKIKSKISKPKKLPKAPRRIP